MTAKNSVPAKTMKAGPALIVFGMSGIGKPRAGTFQEVDSALAIKAAAALGLTVLKLKDAKAQEFATKLPTGRAAANAKGFVPFIRESLFAELKTIAKSQGIEIQESDGNVSSKPKPDKNSGGGKPTSKPRLPNGWDDIEVGDLVLSQDDDPKDGWWQAIVMKKNGEMCSLQWQHRLERRLFLKHKYNLALISPSSDPTAPASSTGEKIPTPIASSAAIRLDQFVLAKEDGPMEQWWEATPVEADADVIKLKWRDYPSLPLIERSKRSLALVHPAPASAMAKKTAGV